jgi:hypothetical protein
MPLVFGIPTFDRLGSCPASPWADLCSLLADCVYENVVLVIDDRMRLLEEIALFIDKNRNLVPAVVMQKLTTLIGVMHNLPHSRILVNTEPLDPSAYNAAALADHVIACARHQLDFEYAFPQSQSDLTTDLRVGAGSAAQGGDSMIFSMPSGEHRTASEQSVANSSSHSSDVCDTPSRSQPLSASQERCSHGSHTSEVAQPPCDVADSVTDLCHASPTDGEQNVENVEPVHSQPEETPLPVVTDFRGLPAESNTESSVAGMIVTPNEPSFSRTQEHIPLGEYQASRTVDSARANRAKISFGTTHDVPGLACTLGRAFLFTNHITILDGLLGTHLGLIVPGKAIQDQDNNIQRFIDSYTLYARIAKTAHPAMRNPVLLLRTYYKPSTPGSVRITPGPTRRQIAHFEQLVAENTGLRVLCEVRVRVGRGKSAHDRYLIVPYCCVELPGGSDVAYAQRRLDRSGKVGKVTRFTSAEKHFRFVSIVTPPTDGLSSKRSDVSRDLQRYEHGAIYLHPSDLPSPADHVGRP